MIFHPIDFYGIVSLDSALVDNLNKYLEENETKLAHAIIKNIPASLEDTQPTIALNPAVPMKLSEAVEIFSKKNFEKHGKQQAQISSSDFEENRRAINEELKKYAEILQESTEELFKTFQNIGIEQWHDRLAHVVGTLKDNLLHKIEELIWALKRLQTLLWRCRLATEPQGVYKTYWLPVAKKWSPQIDRKLYPEMVRTQKELRERYKLFNHKYHYFLKLQEKMDQQLEHLAHFEVLNSWERGSKKQFIRLYQLLKIWDLNSPDKTLDELEFKIAINNTASPDRALVLFKEYYTGLEDKLFETSLYFKSNASELTEGSDQFRQIIDKIKEYEEEADFLGTVLRLYIQFFLKTYKEKNEDEKNSFLNPLFQLRNDTEIVSRLFSELDSALDKGWEKQQQESIQTEDDIIKRLHEMELPLGSIEFYRNHVQNILDSLKKLDELGSLDKEIINICANFYADLLRLDWKYHVAFEYPIFYELFTIHQGLVPPILDRQHFQRIAKFKNLTNDILELLSEEKTFIFSHEIELNLNDIKGYLQDFLGYVQRIFGDFSLTKSKVVMLHHEIAQELLEYRYLFGQFFYKLQKYDTDKQSLRLQFLFVDHYFESVEQRLHDIDFGMWHDQTEEGSEPRYEEESDE